MARIGLDLDGVMYDFEGASRFLLREHFGVDVPKPSAYWNYTKDWLADNGQPDAWEWLWTEGVRNGLFRHGHMLSGAVRAVNKLVNDGHELVVITSRPATARVDTLMWLGFHAVAAAEVHMLGDFKKKSSVRPYCDVYVDDSAANAGDLLKNTPGTVLLWDRPWNQGTPVVANTEAKERFDIAYDWDRVVEVANYGGRL